MTSYEALRSGTAAVDLSARGKIRVTGEDRARLLHGMSTNHISGLKEGQGVYAFFLTAQGRIIADSYIFHLGDSLFLDTEPELTTKLLEHLDRFIIADDVELHDETGEWSVVGLEGPESLQRALEIGVPVPQAEFGLSRWQGGFVTRVASTGAVGVRIFVRQSDFPALSERLREAGVAQASATDAEIVRLENGVARYGNDISERFLVQETGLLHGVHPNKGCYVGQEIVERVRSQAQIHRHLRRIRINSTQAPPAGTKLLRQGKESGEVTSAAFSPALGYVVALAYLRSEAASGFEVAGFDPAITVHLA